MSVSFVFDCVGELFVECVICVAEVTVFYLRVIVLFWVVFFF